MEVHLGMQGKTNAVALTSTTVWLAWTRHHTGMLGCWQVKTKQETVSNHHVLHSPAVRVNHLYLRVRQVQRPKHPCEIEIVIRVVE